MKGQNLFIIVFVLLLIGGGVFFLNNNEKKSIQKEEATQDQLEDTTEGSSNGEGKEGSEASEETEETEAMEESKDVQEIEVEGSNFKFNPNAITVKKGQKTKLVFNNTQGMHDFKVDELGIAAKVIKEGEEETVVFTADKTGTFEFYCSVGQHRANGMKGTLIVE